MKVSSGGGKVVCIVKGERRVEFGMELAPNWFQCWLKNAKLRAIILLFYFKATALSLESCLYNSTNSLLAQSKETLISGYRETLKTQTVATGRRA